MPVINNPQIREASAEIQGLFNLESERGSRTLQIQAEAIGELVSKGAGELLRDAKVIADACATGPGTADLQFAGLDAFQRLNLEPAGLARISHLLTRIPTDPNATDQDIATITKAGTALINHISAQVEYAVACFEKVRTPEGATAAQRLTDLLAKTLSGVVDKSEESAAIAYRTDVAAAIKGGAITEPDSTYIKHTLERHRRESPAAPPATAAQATDLRAAGAEVQSATGQFAVLLGAKFPTDYKAATAQDQAIARVLSGLNDAIDKTSDKLAEKVATAASERSKVKADRTVPVLAALSAVDSCTELVDASKRWKSPHSDPKSTVPEMIRALGGIADRIERAGDPALALVIKKAIVDALNPGLADYRSSLVGICQSSADVSRTASKPTGLSGFIATHTPDWLAGKSLQRAVALSQDERAHKAAGAELEKITAEATKHVTPVASTVTREAAQAATSVSELRDKQLEKLISFNFKQGANGSIVQNNIVNGIARELRGTFFDALIQDTRDGLTRCSSGAGGGVTPAGLRAYLSSAEELKGLAKESRTLGTDPGSELRFIRKVSETLNEISRRYSEVGLFAEAKNVAEAKSTLLQGKLSEFQQGMANVIADRTRIYAAAGETSPLSGLQKFTRLFTARGRAELNARAEVNEALRAVTEIDKLASSTPAAAKVPHADFVTRDQQSNLALHLIGSLARQSGLIGSGQLRDLQRASAVGLVVDLYDLLKATRTDFAAAISPNAGALSVERRAAMIEGSVRLSSLSTSTVDTLRKLERGGSASYGELLTKAPSAVRELVAALTTTAYALDRSAGGGDTLGEDLHKKINKLLGDKTKAFSDGARAVVLGGQSAPVESPLRFESDKALEMLREWEALRLSPNSGPFLEPKSAFREFMEWIINATPQR